MKFAVIDQAEATPIASGTSGAVDLILHDGTRLHGVLAAAQGEDSLVVLNAPAAFFALRLDNGERLLIAKAAVAVCRPLDGAAAN